jgi:hypothetical protein
VKREISLMDQALYEVLRKYKGQEPKVAELKETEIKVRAILHKHLLKIAKLSLIDAMKEIGGGIYPASLELEVIRDVKVRAADVAHQIMETTATAFGVLYAAMKKKKAVGKDRSKTIAEHEGTKIFFEVRRKGWQLKKGTRKRWYAAAEEDVCEMCEANEDDGPIDMIDTFTSGDVAPPAHLNCRCLMGLEL